MLSGAYRHDRQRGFSLIEVLVALLVLSIGLVGLSGLQTNGLRSNHSALLRTQAAMLIGDIIERMRTNATAARSGDYDVAWGTSVVAANCTASCSNVQVAADDLEEWRFNVERLPGGQSQVSVTVAGTATVDVRWTDTRDATNKQTMQVVTTL